MEEEKTTALREVYMQLYNDRKVSSQADFARKLQFGTTPMSQMVRGVKPTPVNLLKGLYNQFRINANYLISDGKEGSIYLDTPKEESNIVTATPLVNVEQQLKNEIFYLKKVIEDKEKIIALLEKYKP